MFPETSATCPLHVASYRLSLTVELREGDKASSLSFYFYKVS